MWIGCWTGYVRAGVGLTGVQAITVQSGGTLTIRSDRPSPAPVRIGLCGEGPGRVQVTADDEIWIVTLDDGRCTSLTAKSDHRQMVLEAMDGVVSLDDLRLTLSRPGVELSNLGVVGATLRDLASRDQAVVARELAAWQPALIVLAFGTNEGFDDRLDARAYEALLRGQIVRLRRLAPGASLMLLGAPDALRNGVSNGCSADGLRGPPPSLAVVRDVQRRVAADMGVAFWDWHGRMGGDCSADRLATRGEPFMLRDRVHFNTAGSDWIGGMLNADLMAAYDAWKSRHGGTQ
jgi:lysophospholipase L1-like esterase